jgi:hypothetical protein
MTIATALMVTRTQDSDEGHAASEAKFEIGS